MQRFERINDMKKECEFFREKLFDYVSGELTPDVTEKVKEHVGICPDCWQIVDDYKKANSTAVNVLKVDFTEDVWEIERKEIIKRVTQKTDVRKEIIKALKILFTTKRVLTSAVATVVLVCFISIGMIQYNQNQELNKEKQIIQNVGLFEDMGILERLDFYQKIAEKGVNL
jgi:predicted anti-sigma-YlaC factor YlaD